MRGAGVVWVVAVVALAPMARAAALRHAAPPPAASALGYATAEDRALYEHLCGQVMAAFDAAHGGFVGHDGVPSEAAVELMLARGRDGDAVALERARHTLRWMHGLMDTVGGGYVLGARDLDMNATSFEKLTVPNARRAELLVLARPAPEADDARNRADLRHVLDYFERVLMDPRAGFYTGQGGSRDLEPESNGLAVQAWCRIGVDTGDPRRRAFAWKTLDRLWNECRDEDLGMVRRDVWGVIHDPSLLPDQAEMGRASLFAWAAAGRDSDLIRARAMAAHLHSRFEDMKKGGFREEYAFERFGHARRARRPADDNARAARFLAEIGVAMGDTAAIGSARRACHAIVKPDDKPRLEYAEWALALRTLWANDLPARSNWVPNARAAIHAAPPPKPRIKRYIHR